MGKHSAQRRSPLPFVLGVIAVLGLAAAAFFGFRILTANNPSSQAAVLPTTTSSSSSTTTTPTPGSSTTTSANGVSSEFAAAQKALQECVARDTAAKAVIDTASKAATDWGNHVKGQNDINSGARTLIQVKTETWAPTRQAGPGEVAAFQAANAGYTGVGGCQNVSAIPAPSDLKAKLDACAARQTALDAYVAAAGAVLNDWATHLSEMADHADGHINSFQAQESWLKRWREAPAHLDPYKAAEAALAAAPACTI